MSIYNWYASFANPKICPDPIFIIGAPRSGTTILAEALGRHSELWVSDESEFLLDLFGHDHVDKAFDRVQALNGPSWLRTQAVDKGEFLAYAGLGINALFTNRSQGKRWIDHTNLYTLMVETISEMFPRAQFIHSLRDGRRAVHSTLHFRKRLPSELQDANCPPNSRPRWLAAGRIAPWAADFSEACTVWSRYVTDAIDFANRHPTRCIEVSNEELIIDAEAVFARIFRFLNLTYEKPPVDFVRSTRINTSFPELYKHPDSARKLSHPWNDWTSEQKDTFVNLAGPAMVLAGQWTPVELEQFAADVSPMPVIASTSPLDQDD